MDSKEAKVQVDAQAQTTPPATPTPVISTKPPSCSKIMLLVNLALRILTFIFLLIALVVLAVDTGILVSSDVAVDVNFQTAASYQYMMAAIVIGFVYTLVQTGFLLYQAITGRRLFQGKAMLHVEFFADKVISTLLVTAAAAGYGATIDLRPWFPSLADFFDKGVAVASLRLFAFFFIEASHIVSFFPKTSC